MMYSCQCTSCSLVLLCFLCRILINQHAQFRKQCNAFFIDLVSTVCFKDNSPPSSAVILHLLSFLMMEAKPVFIVRGTNLLILVSFVCVPVFLLRHIVYADIFLQLNDKC